MFQLCTYICMCVYVCECVCVCIYMQLYLALQACEQRFPGLHVEPDWYVPAVCMCVCIYIYIYINIRAYIFQTCCSRSLISTPTHTHLQYAYMHAYF
jgi:hypothetical protein